MNNRNELLTIGLVVAAVLAACASDQDERGELVQDTTTTMVVADELSGSVCQVTDTDGLADRGANRIALDGAERAADDFGLVVEVLESASEADFAPNIQRFIDADCTLIVTVGAVLSDPTSEAARNNPDQQFAIVDFEYGEPIDNVLTLSFGVAEPSFLAGYLAAGMSVTGRVATYGGVNITPVTVLMDGFVNGVAYYNAQKGTSVEVLGWDGATGLFAGNFDNLDDGFNIASGLAEEDVDIIFPIAGRVGLGSAAFASETGEMRIIGADTDLAESNAADAAVYLTSVLKHMDQSVYAAAQRVIVNGQRGGSYLATMENGGVGLAPYHDQADEISDELKSEIEAIAEEIIAGNIRVT